MISIRDSQLNLNIDRIERSNIGDIDVTILKILIQIFEPVLVAIGSTFLNLVEIPAGPIINDILGFDWINLDQSIIQYYDHYFIFFSTPHFNFPPDFTVPSSLATPEWFSQWAQTVSQEIFGQKDR